MYEKLDFHGLPSGNLKPAFLLISWCAGLCLGQLTGSLIGCIAVSFAVLLMGIGLLYCADSKPARSPWSFTDWAAFWIIVISILKMFGNDVRLHYSIVNTFLRGNIPACALNDPGFPLIYHWIFDLAASVFARLFSIGPEFALDLVSILCFFALIDALQFLSVLLFQTPRARQLSRLLFLFGLGPTYLRALEPASDPFAHLHGMTFQSCFEASFRRPVALNFVLFVYVLSLLVNLYRNRKDRGAAEPLAPGCATYLAALPVLLLVPCALTLPVASEEMSLFFAGAVIFLSLSGLLRWKVSLACLLIMAATAPMSGVFWAALSPDAPFPVPKPVFCGPSLPRWGDTDIVPMFSFAGLRVLFEELGPVFLMALLYPILRKERLGTALVCFILIGFLPAVLLDFQDWPKSAMDRFLFCGTALGFMLAAKPVEFLEMKENGKSLASNIASFSAALAILVVTIASPVVLTRLIWHQDTVERLARALMACSRFQNVLSVVKPRELIESDVLQSHKLVLAGFVVRTPMAGGYVVQNGFDSYQKSARTRPDWFYLPTGDARISGKIPVVNFEGYSLVRAR